MQSLRKSKEELLVAQLAALFLDAPQGGIPRAMAQVAKLDISLSQTRAMLLMARSDHALALGELAEGIGLSDAAAVRMVDGLLADRLVSRREDVSDRRIKRIELTANGKKAINRITEVKRERLRHAMERLLPEEIDRISEALQAPIDRLQLLASETATSEKAADE